MLKLLNILKASKDKFLRVAHMIEALTLIAVIFGGGYAVGQWVTYHVAQSERAEMRRDHLSELERMSRSHEQALEILAGKIVKTTDKVEGVVKEVRKASAKAEKKVNAELINKSVEQANSLNK